MAVKSQENIDAGAGFETKISLLVGTSLDISLQVNPMLRILFPVEPVDIKL